jgi:hypothetical protein
MKWMKQTFAARYNAWAGRIGHIWGDRYWSRVVEGEPPEWAEGTGGPAAMDAGVRPHGGKNGGDPGFSLIPPLLTAPAPGDSAVNRPVSPHQSSFPSKPKRPGGRIRPETGNESELWVKFRAEEDLLL